MPRTRRRIDRETLVLAVVVVVGLSLIVLGLTRTRTGERNGVVLDPAIEAQVPQPGDLVLRQSQVGVDLAPEYTGVLIIDGIRLPEDQLFLEPSLNQVFFTPHQGSDIEEFAPGVHRIEARFWRIADGEATAKSTIWTFSVS